LYSLGHSRSIQGQNFTGGGQGFPRTSTKNAQNPYQNQQSASQLRLGHGQSDQLLNDYSLHSANQLLAKKSLGHLGSPTLDPGRAGNGHVSVHTSAVLKSQQLLNGRQLPPRGLQESKSSSQINFRNAARSIQVDASMSTPNQRGRHQERSAEELAYNASPSQFKRSPHKASRLAGAKSSLSMHGGKAQTFGLPYPKGNRRGNRGDEGKLPGLQDNSLPHMTSIRHQASNISVNNKMQSSSASASGGLGGRDHTDKTTTVRYRGKRYDQVQTTKASISKTAEEEMRREERKKMIRRSNERLKMLDLMGRQRQLKLQQDL